MIRKLHRHLRTLALNGDPRSDHHHGHAEEREPYRASSKRSKRLGANPRRLINESLRRQDADQEIRNLGRW